MSSIGGGIGRRAPRTRSANDICCDVARRRASASLSPAITLTPTMAYGAASWAGRREPLPVDRQGRVEVLRCEVRGKAERQAELGGELGTEQARSEDPDRHLRALARNGHDPLTRRGRREIRHQLEHVLGEMVSRRGSRRSARSVSWSVPGRAADAEVDAAREERRQRAELLGDHVGRVVRQHDPARADADGGRAGGDVRHHQRRRGRGHRHHVVVLGHPDPAVAERFHAAAELTRFVERRPWRATLPDTSKLENRQRNHGTSIQRRRDRQPIQLHASAPTQATISAMLTQPAARDHGPVRARP